MKAHKAYRDRITIQRRTLDETPMGAPVEVWTTLYAGVACNYTQTSGLEKFRGRQVQAEVVAAFELREPPEEITVLDRVIYKGRSFGVVGVMDADDRYIGGSNKIILLTKALGQ